MKQVLAAMGAAALLAASCGQDHNDSTAAPAPAPSTAPADAVGTGLVPVLLAEGLQGPSGSAVGPDGALYVTDGPARSVMRIDAATGATSTLVEGLAEPSVSTSGVVDVVFVGDQVYVLVSMAVGEDGGKASGIYAVNGAQGAELLADLGEFSRDNPPSMAVQVPTGVQFALHPYQGGFLVTDGHHNRVLWVTVEGEVSEFVALDNVVPTGLAVVGDVMYLALAGPLPHNPEDGKVLAFDSEGTEMTVVGSGAPLLVDVEPGPDGRLYALAQGVHSGVGEGSPAQRATGQLLVVNNDGTLSVIADGLDRPMSMSIIGDTAYIVSIAGQVWSINGI